MKDHDTPRYGRPLAGATVVLVAITLFPLLDLAANSAQLVLGIPVSVLWLTSCFIGFVTLAVVGYLRVFRRWAREMDDQNRDAFEHFREEGHP